MIDPKDFRNNKINIYGNGELISSYSGKSYIYFGDGNDNCFHYIDGENHHHRVYGNCVVIVDEI